MAKSPFIAKICKFYKAKRHTHRKQVHMSFNFVRTTMRQSFGEEKKIDARHTKAKDLITQMQIKNSVKCREKRTEHVLLPFQSISNRLCNWLIKMNIYKMLSKRKNRKERTLHADPFISTNISISQFFFCIWRWHKIFLGVFFFCSKFCLYWIGGQHYLVWNNKNQFGNWSSQWSVVRKWREL